MFLAEGGKSGTSIGQKVGWSSSCPNQIVEAQIRMQIPANVSGIECWWDIKDLLPGIELPLASHKSIRV